MTFTILILLSMLSTLGMLKLAAMIADTTLKKMFKNMDEGWYVYYLFMFLMGIAVFFLVYGVIYKIFIHSF